MQRKNLYALPIRLLHTTPNYTQKFIPNDEEEGLANQLASLLKHCADPSSLPQGRQSHAQSIVNGIQNHRYLGPKIMGMYVLSDTFDDAKTLFNEQFHLGFAWPWNWMIRGFVTMGSFQFALLFYFKMLMFGTLPDKFTFPHVIKACGGLKAVSLCELVHDMVRVTGFEMDLFVGSCLIKFYTENGCIDDARSLFCKMPVKDHVLWNVMINGYAKVKDFGNMIEVYGEMRNAGVMPNYTTIACVLSTCASEALVELGSQVHGLVVQCGLEMNSTVVNTLVAMYAKCLCCSDAYRLFEMTPQSDLIAWNAIISGYVQNGLTYNASNMFREMLNAGVKPDSITFTSFLPSISEPANLKQGKEILGHIIRHGVTLDVFLLSALIDMFFKCRDVNMACKIFDLSTTVDVVIYSSMISGYVLNGMCRDSLEIFRKLLQDGIKPNSVTLASVLPACAGLIALNLGKELHEYILKNGLEKLCYVGSALTDMYAKCGRLDLSHHFFLRMSERDAISWNSMITSFTQNGKPEEAIDLFRQMGRQGIKYDCVSLSAALSASGSLPALNYGKEIHTFMIKCSLCSDLFAESTLIDMYAKCGNLNVARQVFNAMREKSDVSWNSIIAAYGNHGILEECLHMFHEMLKSGIKADHITFLVIISACGHAGEVDKGIHYFHCMSHEYGIMARLEHYACMVDLLGRAGRVNEAFELIKAMPFSPDAGIWGTLLGACRVHGNVELAQLASSHLFSLDPKNSGYYILLANTQADTGEWGKVAKTRRLMKDRNVQKVPGYSWVEVYNTTHIFISADSSHPQSVPIYFLLKHLLPELRREGYAPQF